MKSSSTLIVLAAGRGSRFGGLKQFAPMGPCGEKLLEYNLYDALQVGFDRVLFIVRKGMSTRAQALFQALGKRILTAFVYQEIDDLPSGDWTLAPRDKPWGTGHALWVARAQIRGPFGMINADDFYGREALNALSQHLKGSAVTPGSLVTYPVEKTLSRFGPVSRGACRVEGGYLTDIAERREVREIHGAISYQSPQGRKLLPEGIPISMNLWGGTPVLLEHATRYFSDFLRESAADRDAEFYLSTLYKRALREEGLKVSALQTHSEWFGLTYAQDAPYVKQRIAALIQQGTYPAPLWS